MTRTMRSNVGGTLWLAHLIGLFQHAVDLLAGAAVLAVDQVIDGGAVGKAHMPQVAQDIVDR
jgi:hypothetical protein